MKARHTPASVPTHAKGYTVSREYTISECENEHRFEATGGKGPLGWHCLRSSSIRGVWV